MANIGTLTAHIDMNTAGLRRSATRAENTFDRLSRRSTAGLGSITKSVGKLGGALAALGLTVGAVAIFRDLTETGSEFEQTLTTVAGVMRATEEQFGRLTEAARAMGEVTEFTASQAGESLLFLGRAGFDVDKAIAALPGTLDLATAGGLDLGRAADIATNALTAMGLEVDQLGRVNDVFIGTINRSNTNMEQMAEAFKYAAPVANAFGYSIEETAALIGKLGDAGVQGSMAGTQLAMAIQVANDVALKFGYTSSDLLDVIQDMTDAGMTTADFMDEFGIRAGRAALILRDMIDPAKELQETLGGVGGEAETLADKMRSTLGGARKELISVFESIKLDAFDVFRDDLRESIVDLTEWLRENRDNIVGFVRVVVDAFRDLASAVSIVWDVITEVVGGVVDVFEEIRVESEFTAAKLEADGEHIRMAFEPPDVTPWDELWFSLKQLGGNFLEVMKFVGKSTLQVMSGIALVVVDWLKNTVEAVWELGKAIDDILNFRDPRENLKSAVGQLNEFGVSVENIFTGTLRAMSSGWQDLLDNIDRSTLEDQQVDLAFEAAKKAADAERERERERESESETEQPVERPEVHTTKAVSELTSGMDGLAKAADEAARRREAAVDATVDSYRELLSQTNLTKDEMLDIWRGYEDARMEQIAMEGHAMIELGIPIDVIAQLIQRRTEEMNEEQRTLFGDQSEWLKDWADGAAAQMEQGFSNFFFDAMKGEMTGLVDVLESIWDSFLRAIADKAASELGGIFDIALGGEGGSGFVGAIGGIFGLQHGGVVRSPTIAMIGEGGPEAVIPLDRLEDDRFLRRMGVDGGGSNASIVFNISTPDVASFRRSQTQIMAQAATSLNQVERRNL